MGSRFIEIKLNMDLYGYKKNAIVRVRVDNDGIPKEEKWRRRFKDVAIDNSFEIIKRKKKKGGK